MKDFDIIKEKKDWVEIVRVVKKKATNKKSNLIL